MFRILFGRAEQGCRPLWRRPSMLQRKSARWLPRAVVVALVLLGAGCVADDTSSADLLADSSPAAETAPETAANSAVATETGGATDRDFSVSDPGFAALTLDEQIELFLVEPNSDRGAILAAAMGKTNDPRWGAWLLDIFRLGRSTRIDAAVVQSFANLSGLASQPHRTENYRIYGNWVYDSQVDPGEGYDRWKQEIYGSIDTEFQTLLAQVTDIHQLAEIQWGGVARGGIPELNTPARLSVAEADWMTDDELILGVVLNNEPVAYPIRILGHHELANDVVGGVEVAMVYCTLCRSGLLFEREVNGQLLSFQTSGLLIESNKIMVDRETDTLWRHISGTAMTGELAGTKLVQHPVSTTTWADWIAEHPQTEVVDIPGPIFFDDPERPPIAYGYDAGGAYQFYYDDPDVWFPIFDTPDTFSLKEPVMGLSFDDQHLAVSVEALTNQGPQVFDVGSSQILLVPNSGGGRGYDVSGFGLTAGSLDLDSSVVSEDGVAFEDGQVAPRLAVSQLFWFAWYGQHADSNTWPS